jgi:hypothetical protein
MAKVISSADLVDSPDLMELLGDDSRRLGRRIVRATPYGAVPTVGQSSGDIVGEGPSLKTAADKKVDRLCFPDEGFRRIYGTKIIHSIDSSSRKNRTIHEETTNKSEHPDSSIEKIGDDQGDDSNSAQSKTIGQLNASLDSPVGSLQDKWRLLPHFLNIRGLMKQHIDSFDFFVNVEMKQIVQVC